MPVEGECKQFNKLNKECYLSIKKKQLFLITLFLIIGSIILEELLVQEKSPVNNRLVRNAWDAMGGRALSTP